MVHGIQECVRELPDRGVHGQPVVREHDHGVSAKRGAEARLRAGGVLPAPGLLSTLSGCGCAQRGRPRPRAGLRRECRCSRAPVESSGPMRISCGHRSPASGSSATDVRRLRAAGESPQAMSEATAALLLRGMHPPKHMGVGNSVWAEGWAAPVTGPSRPQVGEVFALSLHSRNERRAVAVTEVLGGQPESGVRRRFLRTHEVGPALLGMWPIRI